MQATQLQSHGHPLYLVQQTGKKQHSSLFAALLLGLAFNCSLVSVMGTKLGFFESLVGNSISALAMILLIVVSYFRAKRFKFASLPQTLKMSLILLVVTVLVLGAGGAATVPRHLKTMVLINTGGIILTIIALAVSVRVFSYKEIVRGLILFSIVELIGCLFLFVTNADVNPNAISVRAAVAGMCLFSLLNNKALQIIAVLGCLGFSVVLECRTSAVALVGAMTFLFVERRSRKNREVFLILISAGFILTLFFLPNILGALQDLAFKFLDSDNPIAKLFLYDKSTLSIRYDYLDRFEIWEYSWSFIQQKPVFGHGIGTEHEIMQVRSHSAYLSLLFEGGVVLLAAWLYLYVPCLVSLFNRDWVARVGDTKLYFLSTMLLGYMLLAGLVETSGLASVSTPINLIFIFLIIWLFQPNPDCE